MNPTPDGENTAHWDIDTLQISNYKPKKGHTMRMQKNVYIECHVELEVEITPEPTDADLERIDDELENELLESIYAARQATDVVKRVVKVEKFEVTIRSDFIYDEGWEGALRWEDVDD